jgi:hypothetical protein
MFKYSLIVYSYNYYYDFVVDFDFVTFPYVYIRSCTCIFTSRPRMTILLKAAQQSSEEIVLLYSCITTTLKKHLQIEAWQYFGSFELFHCRGLPSLPTCRHYQARINKATVLNLTGALITWQDGISMVYFK